MSDIVASTPSSSRALTAGLAYFALVFGAGFILGAVRVPFLAPRFGERTAELLEMPVMLIVVVSAARFVVRRFALPSAAGPRVVAGCVGLSLLVSAELLLVMGLRRQPLGAYIASRDPVSGSVYLAMLAPSDAVLDAALADSAAGYSRKRGQSPIP